MALIRRIRKIVRKSVLIPFSPSRKPCIKKILYTIYLKTRDKFFKPFFYDIENY